MILIESEKLGWTVLRLGVKWPNPVSDLHMFAKRLGLNPSLFVNDPIRPRYNIYDAETAKKALKLGAKAIQVFL